MSNLLKLKADEIDAICGLIGIAKCKNVTEICTIPIILPLRSK